MQTVSVSVAATIALERILVLGVHQALAGFTVCGFL
jgi:hypothetical protein